MNNFTNLVGSFSSNRIILIITVVIVTWFLSKMVQLTMNRFAEKYAAQRIMIKNMIPLMNIGINFAGLYLIIFRVLRISSDSFIALGVSAGVAIGFAVKDLLANIFGGLVILSTRPFNIGDKVEVGNYYGEVTDITLLKVKMTTLDDSVITIPNKLFLESSISNSNSGELNCQVVTSFNIPYNTNLDEFTSVAYEAAYSSPYTYMKKPISVLFSDEHTMHKHTIKVKIKSYVYDHRYEKAYSSDLYQRIQKWCVKNQL
jgi:small-conductance mechanosensitive channel